MIRIYLRHIINNHKTQGEWKVYLTIGITFTSSKNSDETHTIHTKSDNIETMMGSEKDAIIEELFESLLHGFNKDLKNQ